MSFCEICEHMCLLNALFQASKHLTSMWYSPSSQGCRLCEAGRARTSAQKPRPATPPYQGCFVKVLHHCQKASKASYLDKPWQAKTLTNKAKFMHINLQFICKWPSFLKILGIVYSTIQFSIPGSTGNTGTGEDPDTLGSNSRGPRAAKRVGSSMSSRSLQLLLMVTSNRISIPSKYIQVFPDQQTPWLPKNAVSKPNQKPLEKVGSSAILEAREDFPRCSFCRKWRLTPSVSGA